MPPAGERGAEGASGKRGAAAANESEIPVVEPLTVEQRVERLEKVLRRARWLNVGLLVAVLGLAGGLAYDFLGVRGTVRARRCIVVNERGAAVEIESNAEGDGIVSLHDANNVPRVLIGNSRKGFGTVELYSGSEQKLVSIGGSGSGGQIAVYNNSGRKVIDAQASKTNSGAIAVHDFDGNYAHGLFGDRR
ncbi:MAG: hypothetical protein JSS02_30380 [Planctomycetes bacterium]|nr:hypothetical protein [Planctomycetota bacterium]